MPDAPTAHGPRHALTWTLSILAAPLLYALSIGPVLYLREKGILPTAHPSALDSFYAPLGACFRPFPSLEKAMIMYMEWWVQLGRHP